MQSTEISVAVIDTQPLYRDALVRLFEQETDMQVVGWAPPNEKSLELVDRERPDVCVIDYDMPDKDGLALLNALCELRSPPRILVLAGTGQLEDAYKMIEAGAAGCLMKSAEGSEIADTVRRIAAGEDVLHAAIQTSIAGQIRENARNSRGTVSERELEILRLTSQGLSAHEIGRELSLAESTVKTHLTRIYGKLGVSERAAAVAEAMRSGLID